jgi:hypothetical protein
VGIAQPAEQNRHNADQEKSENAQGHGATASRCGNAIPALLHIPRIHLSHRHTVFRIRNYFNNLDI